MIMALCVLAAIAVSLVLMTKGCQNDSAPSATLHPGS
jgi:hypothetical protein